MISIAADAVKYVYSYHYIRLNPIPDSAVTAHVLPVPLHAGTMYSKTCAFYRISCIGY